MAKRPAAFLAAMFLVLLTYGSAAAGYPHVTAGLTTGQMIPGQTYSFVSTMVADEETAPFKLVLEADPRTTIVGINPGARGTCLQTNDQRVDCDIAPGTSPALVYVNVKYTKIMPCRYGLQFKASLITAGYGTLTALTAASDSVGCNRVYLPALVQVAKPPTVYLPVTRR